MLRIMKAVVLEKFGGPEVLEVREAPDPEPGEHEILVRLRAAGINRADLLQRQGKYPAPKDSPQQIPGLEFAGEVAALGPEAKKWRVGDRVFGIVGGGAHAEMLVTHERQVAAIPKNLDWAQAAAVPEAFITAHDAVWKQGELAAGENLLVHAIGSGVGLAAAQLGVARAARVFGTSRTQEKLDRARDFGMSEGIALGRDISALAERVKSWTSGHGADVVLDLVGGSYVPASIECMAVKGRLLLVGTVAGGKADITLGQVMSRRMKIIGTVLRSRSLEEKIAATAAFSADVVPLLAAGKVCPVLDSAFPLAEVQAAHGRVEANQTFGKVVLKMD